MRFRSGFVCAALVGVCLGVPAAALAEAPPNDNRTAAEVIPTFPATVAGTTVGATVERLDPQVSDCGRVEGTVWYRIPSAPDGTIVLGVQGADLAPVLRVYTLRANSIDELVCASGKKGQQAVVGFEAERGAGYLVLVGKRPGTADSAFQLTAQLYFPPANDGRGQAARLSVPGKVEGSTFGATASDNDPGACGLDGGTVWYRVVPGKTERVVLQLSAAGNLDASMVVVERIRSKSEEVACAGTDRLGKAVTAFTVDESATYYVVVGQQEGSPPGSFTLRALAAQPLEKAPGTRLPATGVGTTVNGLTDVNDVWWTSMKAGSTHRISLRSTGCVRMTITGPIGKIGSLACNGYQAFTPGPDGGGKYVFEVIAPKSKRTIAYRLRVASARIDDVGVGLELQNLSTARGTLAPSGVDVVDLYHFDVAQRSEVRLRLAQPGGRKFSIRLMTDTGRTLRTSAEEISIKLDRGRYVVAVGGAPGSRAGAYRLALVVRQVTKTTIVASETEIEPGATFSLTVATSPVPDGGWTEIQIDRFDPLTGWAFNRKLRVPGAGATVTWKPPLPGRWRARAQYLGTLRFSPSRSPYVRLLVAKPLPDET